MFNSRGILGQIQDVKAHPRQYTKLTLDILDTFLQDLSYRDKPINIEVMEDGRICCEQPCTPNDCICEKKCVDQPSATTMVYGHEKARHIEIDQLDYGYIVRVGCQSFAIGDLATLTSMLIQYMKYPNDTEAEWRSGELKF